MCLKIKWKNPPKHSMLDDVLAILRKNPGRWAFLKNYKGGGATAMASSYRRKHKEFEWVAVQKKGSSDLYGRYKED